MSASIRRILTGLVLLAWVVSGVAPALAQQNQADGYLGNQQGFSAPFDQGIADLDAYWRDVFARAGVPYRSPQVRRFEEAIYTACGPIDPLTGPNYCPRDETIYLTFSAFPLIGIDTSVVYNLLAIAAHEWGHHIQHLLGVLPQGSSAFELQADCLGGAFTKHAGELGRLDPGDVASAAKASIAAAGPADQPENQQDPHGDQDHRLTSFMNGYINGLPKCGLPGPVGSIETTGNGEQPASATKPTPTVSSTLPTRPSTPTEISLSPSTALPPLSLRRLIPTTLSLSPGQTFRLNDEGAASFDDVVANLPDPATAERQLRDWGLAENYYRVFAADNPPRNAAGWVELSVDRFDSVDGAAQALVAFADARRASHHEQGIDLGLFSDQSEAMRGPAYNGNEVTIFARRGDLVIRATGITPKGDPTADVIEAILKILVPLVDEPRVVSSELLASLPTEANMPTGLRMTEEHARSAATIAETFPDSGAAEQLFQHWGWRENAARVFTGQSAAGTTRIEVSVFRLADPDMAAQALDYFLRGRATVDGLSEVAPPDVGVSGMRAIAGEVAGSQEATVYLFRGASLFRVTAIGSGDPMSDLEELLRSWR